MEKYIALLRGINVGGKNKISMSALKTVFEEVGFIGVKTYINSGNIVFSSAIQDISELAGISESAITDNFGLNIPVVIRSVKDLADILAQAPPWWDRDKGAVNYAIFVIPPFAVEEVFAVIGEAKPGYEQVDHYGNVIFWSAPRETFAKTRWSKIAGSSANNHVTIRNANTVNKLLQL